MNEATITFVRQHADDDVRQLALRMKQGDDVDLKAALQQIQGRQTARRKLPTWAACDDILYPPHLSMEQCSSEQTARYKAAVAEKLIASTETSASTPPTETTLIDLTGGFGVDFSFLAPLFTKAVYVERQETLCRLARHNLQALGLHHAEVVCADSEDYLEAVKANSESRFFFLDPARRNEQGGRTYGLSDCTPDVLALRDELLQKADYVMLKLSPMLDWRKTVEDLGRNHVAQVHIVATGNEVKELLVVMQPITETLNVTCINDNNPFTVEIKAIDAIAPISSKAAMPTKAPIPSKAPITSKAAMPSISSFLYEPNAAIMKGGFFAELSARYGVSQIAQNSHLFVSEQRVEGFPGREFRIKAVTTMNKKELKQALQGIAQANIAVRNFPLSVAELRKRLKMSEGGSTYIFATTLANGEHVLFICEKMRNEE